MWALSLARAIRTGLEPVSRWSGAIGAVCLIVGMLTVVAEVALRSTLSITFSGTIEIIQCLLVIIIFSGMAYAQLKKKHVRVDILVSRFSPTAKLATTACAELVALGIVGIISWRSVVQAQYSVVTQTHTGLMGIPLWPLAVLTAIFMGIFTLALLTSFLESLGELIALGVRKYLWIIPGIIVTFILFAMSFWPSIFLPIKIAPQTFGVISILVMFGLIFLNVHIGAATAIVALWGIAYLAFPGAGLTILGMTSQSTASNYSWSVLPLFILMGFIVVSTGLSRSLYYTAHKWLGHFPGGLASATIGASAVFAAVVGDPMSGAVALSSVALPEMKTYKYDDKLATGAIASGSTIGGLIPPSLAFIVYGMTVEQSIGRLFMAGVLPGILVASAFILLISALCSINPKLGPPGPVTTFKEKVVSVRGSWPILLLIILVLGGIYGGIFSATEAGSIGAFGALVFGLAMGRLTFKASLQQAIEAVQMAGMIFFMLIYATVFAQFFAITQFPIVLAEFITGLAVSKYITLTAILLMYFGFGCILPSIPVIVLTMPIIFPLIIGLGFDPIWFGVLMILLSQVALLTPPVGMTVFAMSGVTDVPIYTIFRGVVPFWITLLAVTVLLVAFPQISLVLPNLMLGS